MSAGQVLFAFEYEKEKRYLVTTYIGERIMGEFMNETTEVVFIKNLYSTGFLKINKSHIKTRQLLDANDSIAENIPVKAKIEATAIAMNPQLSLAGDVGIPLGGPAAFLKTGYVTRADMNFALPFSFLSHSPFEWRLGLSGGYGVFNAQGNTFTGKLTVIPIMGYLRFKWDALRFFLKPYATVGSGVTLTGMTKNITATGENSSESSPDLTLSGSLGVEAILGRRFALFLEVSSYTIFEGMNGMFLKINFGTGYRI